MLILKIASWVAVAAVILAIGFIAGQLSSRKIKLDIVKDGKINGWVIVCFILAFNLFFFALGFLGVKSVKDAWDAPMGDRVIYFSIIMSGIWFTSKRVQDVAKIMAAVKEKIAAKKIENGNLNGGFDGKAG